jgi:hypothetical protein
MVRMRRALSPHPNTPSPYVTEVAAEVRRDGGRLELRYVLAGEMGEVQVPPQAPSERRDELWRHTCFEAFVRGPGEAYVELNFSPSTEWAAYLFGGYREGMTDAEAAPEVHAARTARTLEVTASVELPRDLADADWRVAVTAVVETLDGAVSYWSVQHPAGKPDFHHPDCFCLDLPAGREP